MTNNTFILGLTATCRRAIHSVCVDANKGQEDWVLSWTNETRDELANTIWEYIFPCISDAHKLIERDMTTETLRTVPVYYVQPFYPEYPAYVDSVLFWTIAYSVADDWHERDWDCSAYAISDSDTESVSVSLNANTAAAVVCCVLLLVCAIALITHTVVSLKMKSTKLLSKTPLVTA